jgi:predicted DNA-binding transcriptional regulator AlpA/uncharacterized small protein (DUF1192 family)
MSQHQNKSAKGHSQSHQSRLSRKEARRRALQSEVARIIARRDAGDYRPDDILRLAAASRMLGIHPKTLYRWRQTRTDFPPAVMLSASSIGFRYKDLVAFQERLLAPSNTILAQRHGHPRRQELELRDEVAQLKAEIERLKAATAELAV